MNSRTRVIRALSILVMLTGGGAAGFVVLEGMSWLDAIYLSVSTISTVGFGDITPLTGPGKLFAIALIVGGVGVLLV